MACRAFPVVIAAPSGAGKTSLAHALVARHADLVFSISATTRAARSHERAGIDYIFTDEPGFERMVATGELLEWAVVHGRRYGTPRSAVESALAGGRSVLLDIDVQGARQVRRAFPDAVLIFILPPSAEELHRRLAGRGSEGGSELRRRLENARAELACADEFDYVVVNDEFERALGALEAILTAERHRWRRAADGAQWIGRLEGDLADILSRSE